PCWLSARGESRLAREAVGGRPCGSGHAGTAGSGAHVVPAEAPGGVSFRPRGEHGGLLAKASDYAIGDPRADLAPERIAHQVVGIPCAAQFRVRSEPSEMRVKTVALELAVDQRRYFFLHGHHLWSLRVSRRGRSFSAIASRARNILERTVPIGQFMMVAMSS